MSIFKQTLSLIRSRINQYMEDNLCPFQIACFSFLLVFPYEKLINYEPKIIIIVQNIICFIITQYGKNINNCSALFTSITPNFIVPFNCLFISLYTDTIL